jgi:LysR family transcriptional regulator, transcriptional activator for dmlA
VNKYPGPDDLRVFMAVARNASFARAADEMGVSAAYVTKRIRILEQCIGTKLLHRTTRKVSVTESGEIVYEQAQRILGGLDRLVEEANPSRQETRGYLRVGSSVGFGRKYVAPALGRMVEKYPKLEVRFEVLDRVIDPADEGFDLDVRVGDDIAQHLVARPLARNYRILCASPGYLARHGKPKSLDELSQHNCLVIKERDHPFGTWALRSERGEEKIKVTGNLSTNHGEVAVQWAAAGYGILLRSIWDVGPLLESGQLVPVLERYRQNADIWAVYPSELKQSSKIRACIEFLRSDFGTLAKATKEAP